MGLYDTIECRYPLPDPRLQDADFQTKDLIDTSWLSSLVEKKKGSKADHSAESAAPGAGDEDRPAEVRLLEQLRRRRAELSQLLEECSSHWGFEDPVYRLYHQSFKVYQLQAATENIVERLRTLAPDVELNPWFREIVESGTGLSFESENDTRWLEVTRPIVEAFFHARYFLEMAVRYGSLEKPPHPLPSGYAALLYLYGLR